MVRSWFTFFAFLLCLHNPAQLKFLVEDFEGFSTGDEGFKEAGLFTFGSVNTTINQQNSTRQQYSGSRSLLLTKKGKETFGGWGKGIGLNIQLDQSTDYINFYVKMKAGQTANIKVELQEDDDNSQDFSKDKDDQWVCPTTLSGTGEWQLISLPLKSFKDNNQGGDYSFNASYRGGKLFVFLISFDQIEKIPDGTTCLFDFICFSKGPLKTANVFDPVTTQQGSFCSLGIWSVEGNTGNFTDIATAFSKHFSGNKQPGIVHFFQSFSTEGDGGKYHYPSVERINKVIDAGYIPMITLEDHFVNAKANARQPNVYSILEGHFDSFFGYWALHIKQVKGTVLLRILHEFNGDWYPWCTVKNDQNPEMVARTFRYIVNIFRQNNVTNVKFIWCPNSMSVPQESWNYIMDAYPGDDYVDMIGLDVYNGAGKGKGVSIWRSFRREAAENYFILSTEKSYKPLLICETASRERQKGEPGQSKADWMADMANTLKSDMKSIRMMAWFNEHEAFLINSSPSSVRGFQNAFMNDPYFSDGSADFKAFMEGKKK